MEKKITLAEVMESLNNGGFTCSLSGAVLDLPVDNLYLCLNTGIDLDGLYKNGQAVWQVSTVEGWNHLCDTLISWVKYGFCYDCGAYHPIRNWQGMRWYASDCEEYQKSLAPKARKEEQKRAETICIHCDDFFYADIFPEGSDCPNRCGRKLFLRP